MNMRALQQAEPGQAVTVEGVVVPAERGRQAVEVWRFTTDRHEAEDHPLNHPLG
jgi:hypothetical protein